MQTSGFSFNLTISIEGNLALRNKLKRSCGERRQFAMAGEIN